VFHRQTIHKESHPAALLNHQCAPIRPQQLPTLRLCVHFQHRQDGKHCHTIYISLRKLLMKPLEIHAPTAAANHILYLSQHQCQA
jgi:hypothetical protein